MSEWLPIETAPMQQWIRTKREGEDGEEVCAGKLFDEGVEWFDRDGRATFTHSTFLRPTHWQPLEPPTSASPE